MTVPQQSVVLDETLHRADTDPLIGTVISGRFRIVEQLARGGMGVIYRAEQAPLGRHVAIKVLSDKYASDKDPEFRKRFLLEASTAANLSHPNTVTVFDYGQGENGIYYIAMELVNGQTLKRVLTDQGPLTPERALNIAKQICRSLREAHRLGVIHRDMKPSNVMLVNRDGEDFVKVLDFGLVKAVDNADPEQDLTQQGMFVGSPRYMSPEQIQGEHVDGRSDIYSVGVLMYEMLTGRPPFSRDKQMQVLIDHVREPVPPMTMPEGCPSIAHEVQEVVFKCLEKSPVNRYPDMESLLIAIKMAAKDANLAPSRDVDLALYPGSADSGIHSLPELTGPTLSGTLQHPSSNPPRLTTSQEQLAARRQADTVVTASGSVETLAADEGDERSAPSMSVPIGLSILSLLIALISAIIFVATSRGGSSSGLGSLEPPRGHRGSSAVSDTPESSVTGNRENEILSAEAPNRESGVVPASTANLPEPSPSATPTPAQDGPVRLLVSLTSEPLGAQVEIGEHEYGATPTQVELSGELAKPGSTLDIHFSHPGYRPLTVSRTVRGQTLQVDASLSPLPRRRPRAERTTVTAASTTPAAAPIERRIEGYRDSPY